MRDNLLLAGEGTYDETKLCADLVGSFCAASVAKDEAKTGLMVWGQPWDVAGWEMTDSFVQNWGWITKGCDLLLHSTNYWREHRGDKPLRLKNKV